MQRKIKLHSRGMHNFTEMWFTLMLIEGKALQMMDKNGPHCEVMQLSEDELQSSSLVWRKLQGRCIALDSVQLCSY